MDYQFYPTPAKTAALMWSKFKRPIGLVCDPSAGQGHLIRHAREGFVGVDGDDLPWMASLLEDTTSDYQRGKMREYGRLKFSTERRCDGRDFLAIEINPDHHATLRSLGGKVIGYDFLQVQSLAAVNQVIMNPPFAEGAKHVLHAWKVLHDGEIVAIVNAETIRNPYSQERQALVELLKKHGSVEFLQGQFLGNDVERKTAVEVALLYLEKESESAFDLGFDSLKKRGEVQEIDPAIAQALALPENFIENTYYRFIHAVEMARKAAEYHAMFKAAQDALGLSLTDMQSKGVGSDFREQSKGIKKEANKAFRESYEKLQQRAWGQIIRSSLLTDKLSNQARRKVESEANSIYELEFSISNVHGFLAGVIASMGDIYAEMVCGLFDTIIQRSSDNATFYKSWKSNERHKFGMRIKRSRFIIPGFSLSYSGRELSYESKSFLSDIDKVFGYLHGISDKYDGLVQAFDSGKHMKGGRISTQFFEFRYYSGTTTIHFYPKSEEIIEKLNRFVGAHRQWLPQQMEEANSDFQKQYEQAEKMTKGYENRWKETAECRNSLWYDNRVYAMITERPTEDHYRTMQAMAQCIEQEHQALGMQCGPALKYEKAAEMPALPAKQEEKHPEPEAQADEDGQLLLIAA